MSPADVALEVIRSIQTPRVIWNTALARAGSYIQQTGQQATRVELRNNTLLVTLPSELKALALTRPDRILEIERLLKEVSGREIRVCYNSPTPKR